MTQARFDLVKEVREDYLRETGEDPGRDAALVLIDRMCAAFGEKVEGAGYEYAVREMPSIAKHLMWRWTGEAGRELRAEMARQEVTQ